MEISVYSDDGKYRYLSEERISDSSDRELLIIMLNPATTVETADDPNRRRHTRSVYKKFAKRQGFGILTAANLFAFRASDHEELFRADDPVGPENDTWICNAVGRADMVLVAWGTHGCFRNRSSEVLKKILPVQTPYHMGLNKSGEPKQPRVWRKASQPCLWE